MLTPELLEQIKANPDDLAKILENAGIKVEKDEPPAPDAGDGDDDISKLPETMQKYIKKLRDENAKHRTEKNNAKAAQEAAERKALEEQGKFKELYENTNKELEALKAQAQEARTYAETLEATRRKELLEKLPADKRSKYKEVSINLLNDIVSDFLATNPAHSPGTGGNNGAGGVTTLEGMSDQQIMDLWSQNPKLAEKLTAELVQKQIMNK